MNVFISAVEIATPIDLWVVEILRDSHDFERSVPFIFKSTRL